MYHEFIKIKKEDIPNRFNYSLISNYTSIKVSDDIILNNSLFLKGYNTFKVYWHNKGEGLDYYGNTIIPTESLEKFIENIEQVKCKPKYKQQLKDLIELCRKAIEEDKYVIHFGI